MEFSEIIRVRRSVRSYSSEVPEPAEVDRIIDIARRAPTAGYSQGIDFLVVDDPDQLAAFWAFTAGEDEGDHGGSDRPPVLVMVWSDPQRYLDRYSEADKIGFGLDHADAWPVRFWDVDGGMAAMQLQLAAVDAGLDTWFFGIPDDTAVRAHFGVPANRNMIGIIALGFRDPDEVPTGSGVKRRRRPLDEQLHRNGW